MSLTIVALDGQENFLQFLDPELCTLTETTETKGLRTLEFIYTFQEYGEDKNLFKNGNKIWVQGDSNIDDCLYVINSNVNTDIYQENQFKMEIEEVLVELNNAPLFSQTELTTANGFNISTVNGKQEVALNWNAFNYWFGDYFNIGVIQQCISTYADKISITGTLTRMALLRYIEEETGNVFITRYEKDELNNTIHRYLDFLNPQYTQKDWELNLEYDFITIVNGECYDKDGNITTEEKPSEIIPVDDEGQDLENEYSPEDDIIEDEDGKTFTPVTNLNPENIDFRITDKNGQLLNVNGEHCSEEDEDALLWTSEEIGFTGEEEHIVIKLQKNKQNVSIDTYTKSFVIEGGIKGFYPSYVEEYTTIADEELAEHQKGDVNLIDDSYFEFYDHVNNVAVFRSCLNVEIGHVHEEILDFGFNLENVEFDVDETEVYTAVAPSLELSENSGDSKALTRTDLGTIINRWKNLSVTKGVSIPMIVQKINVTASSLENAKRSLGSYVNNSNADVSTNINTNYWRRPLKPNDNTDSDDKTYEFWRATAYWRAPFTKRTGTLEIESNNLQNKDYINIHGKPDSRNERGVLIQNKSGTTTTTDEDIFSIYNQVAMYLKEHQQREFNITVDVANLRNKQFNQYGLYDKVYLKLPDTNELVIARVSKTTKEAHDIAKNTIELANYNITQIKNIQQDTYLEAKNFTFKYPSSHKFEVRLVNSDWDPEDPDSLHYPPTKLITFILYSIENQNRTFKKTYTRLTDAYGKTNITLKLPPGTYELDVTFPGDEEFLETNTTVTCRVTGTLPVTKKTTTKKKKTSKKKATTKSKTTKKTSAKKKNTSKTISKLDLKKITKALSKKKKTPVGHYSLLELAGMKLQGVTNKKVNTYYNKCGHSPDNKEIVSISKPSGPDANKYGYRLYKTVFKNKCPICGRSGTLAFDGGSKNKCIKSAGAYGRGYKIGVPEHEITCNACDSDFCGVTGIEKWSPPRGRLTTIKKPVKSSQSEFNKLVKGKLKYGTKTIQVKKKAVTSTKTKRRTIKNNNINSFVRQKALDIVKDSTGLTAVKKIVQYMDRIPWKDYEDFHRTPKMVIQEWGGNCCDLTRCFFELCDAAGCTEYFNFYYVHVTGHVYGIVEGKKTGKWVYVDNASDYHTAWSYVCMDYPHGGRTSTYPNLPF